MGQFDNIGINFFPTGMPDLSSFTFSNYTPMDTSFLNVPQLQMPTFNFDLSTALSGGWNNFNTFNTFSFDLPFTMFDTFQSTTFTQSASTYQTSSTQTSTSVTLPSTLPEINKALNSSGTYNLNYWKKLGYNENKGISLARDAKSHATSEPNGKCATYVKKSMQRALNIPYKYGVDGCEVGDKILNNDKNFKLVYDSSRDGNSCPFKAGDIPAGAVVVYPSRGYSSHRAGHVEIALGNGKGAADFVSKRLFMNWGRHKEPKQIYIPV